MSYCRFSSDNFQCDAYCYESCGGGFVIHVASARPVIDDTTPVEPDDMLSLSNTEFSELFHRQHSWLENCESRPIGLSRDGMTLEYSTAGECADGLESLRNEGYNIPQYAIDELREESE